MSTLLERAKSHYKAKLSAEPRELQIPEWDATVYIRPGISLHNLGEIMELANACLLYTSPSPRDKRQSRMPSSA